MVPKRGYRGKANENDHLGIHDESEITKELIQRIQNRIAVTSVGPSALRGQGAAGLLSATHNFLKRMDPSRFSTNREATFRRRLDVETAKLVKAFPKGGKSWGAARKAINLFLRDCLYNAYLRETHSLAQARHWFELPLDSETAKGLLRSPGGEMLPKWPGIKHLDAEVSGARIRISRERLPICTALQESISMSSSGGCGIEEARAGQAPAGGSWRLAVHSDSYRGGPVAQYPWNDQDHLRSREFEYLHGRLSRRRLWDVNTHSLRESLVKETYSISVTRGSRSWNRAGYGRPERATRCSRLQPCLAC